MSESPPPKTVELHRLTLSFACLRICKDKAVEALAHSIDRSGQLTPVVVVAQDQETLVLIDGYLRLQAFRRLGQDTCLMNLWDCDVPQALLRSLAALQARPWDALEEAGILRELVLRFQYSQREIAKRSGHDVSWVNRRLALINGLSDDLVTAVQEGQMTTWSASRILASLARANEAHARALLQAHHENPLSTRGPLATGCGYRRKDPQAVDARSARRF